MSELDPAIAKLEKQLLVLQRKLERSEWHRVDLENQHDRDQHLYRRLQADLEAARREAEIEAALERVRARAMAMRSSEELRDMVVAVLDEMKALAFPSGRCTLILFDRATGDGQFWMSGLADGALPERFHVPYHELPTYRALHDAWREGTPYVTVELAGEAKRRQDDFWFEHTEFRRLPAAAQAGMRRQESLWLSNAVMAHGIVQAVGPEPLPDDKADILRRFATVIELTYTRVVDLEQAEARSREAQIEAAMERVRSRALAMTSSDELLDVVFTIRREFAGLGLDCGAFWHTRYTPEVYQKALTSIDGEKLAAVMELPRDFASNPALAAWEHGDEAVGVFPFDAEAGSQYLRHMVTKGRFSEVDPEAITEAMVREHGGLTFVQARTSHGEIGYSLWGEAEPTEEARAVLVRFAGAFDLAYRRFEDLQQAEARVRETQVELALERVRAQSLRMQHSSELVATSAVFHEQLRALGVPTEFSYVWLPDEAAGKHQFWATWTEDDGGDPVSRSRAVTYALDKDEPYTAACFAAWASDDPVHVEAIPPDDVEGFFDTWAELLQDAEHLRAERFPDGITYAEGYMAYGCFGINIRRAPTDEERDVLRRFAVEFERAYTRFLDLQRAEAQAREAEIEAALERVRSRTMAMQSSDELPEAANLLFQQVRSLGMPAWSAGYCIWDEDKQGATQWVSTEGKLLPPFHTPLTEDPTFVHFREAHERGEPLFVEEVEGEALVEHYRYMSGLPVVGDLITALLADDIPLPTSQINHCAYFTHGFLLFITYEPVPEAHDLFQRFAKVFDQTYTRYLDLKRAEAQAREAEIEAALERVRSRTMGMQRSDELPEAATLLFDQVKALGMPAWSAGYCIWDEDKRGATLWMSSEGVLQAPVHTPVTEDPYLKGFREGYDLGVPLHVHDMGGEALVEHYAYMRTLPVVGEVLDSIIEAGHPLPTYQVNHCAYFSHGFLLFITYEPVPEAHDIFRRFARVFDQTYTRYLDLQRAEEQAREAEIETAFERVRSRALAMQSSDELREVAAVLREQMGGLGQPDLEACAIHLYDTAAGTVDDPDVFEAWSAIRLPGDDGQILTETVRFPRSLPIMQECLARYASGETEYVVVHEGEESGEFFAALEAAAPRVYEALRPLAEAPELVPPRAFWSFSDFSGGSLLMVTYELPTADARDLLRRCARVFDLAYKRFVGLRLAEQKAREDARQAALARVRAEIASMRTAEDLRRITPLVWRELTALGVPFFRCGVFIVDEAAEESEAFLTTPGGDALAALRLPFGALPTLDAAVGAWRGGRAHTDAWTRQQFETWTAALTAQGLLLPADGAPTAEPPETLALHFAPFEQGMLYVGSAEPLTADEASAAQALADAFAVAYARYEDFQRLEAKNREVEAAMAELRAAQAQLVQSEKMASLGQLTAGIAHEIKNPLNFVTNFATLSKELAGELAEETDPDERAALLADLTSNAAKIEEHGRRADAIVRSMMEHARSGSGERQSVALNALVEEYATHAEHAMRVRHPDFHPALSVRLGPGVGEVEVAPQEIGRVLINLVDNALDAVRQRAGQENGAYAPAVTVSTRRTAAGAEVRVEDNGPGMAPGVAAKVFEPFFTTKPTGEGTGLGLSLSHDIVVQGYSGALTVESAEGEGAAFVVSLPVATGS